MTDNVHVKTGIAPRNDRGEVNPGSEVYWCGLPVVAEEFHFLDATHVLLFLRNGAGSIFPCVKCLGAIAEVLRQEIEE